VYRVPEALLLRQAAKANAGAAGADASEESVGGALVERAS
jgi:hypothetical protein